MAVSVDKLQIAGIIVAGILWILIYTPLLIYHGRRYYRNRNHVVYQARYAVITIYELVFITIKLIYTTFDNALVIILGESAAITSFVQSISALLAWLLLYSFVWRFWCISYDIKWTKCIINNQWKTIINQEISTCRSEKHNNWYLKHKSTFGNYKWLKWRLFLVAFLSSASFSIGNALGASIFASQVNPYLTQIIASWSYMLPFIFLVIIYYKTPSILDNFYVQKELRYIFVLLCIDYSAFYGGRIFAVLCGNMLNDTAMSILFTVVYHFIIGAQFGAVMISTAWVNAKVMNIVNHEQYKMQELTLENETSNEDHTMNVNLIQIQPKPKISKQGSWMDKDLNEILCHPLGFETFMNHLCHEFSMENLLSLVEFLQFQKCAAEKIGYYQNGDIERQRLLCDEIILSKEVPLSGIVSDDKIDLKAKAYALYIKYIKNGATYTINISYGQRLKLIELIGDHDDVSLLNNDELTDIELMNIFDGACREIKRLMNDSYKRFKLTPEYKRLVNDLVFV